MAKGMSTTTLLLIGGGLIGGYFLLSKTGVLGPSGPSAEDMAIMQMLADSQNASRVQQQEMMAIVTELRAGAAGSAAQQDRWSSPELYLKFAEMGVNIAGMFV